MIDTSRHETADEYRLVIAQHGFFRVILCRDGIQFIVQKRKKEEPSAHGALLATSPPKKLCYACAPV